MYYIRITVTILSAIFVTMATVYYFLLAIKRVRGDTSEKTSIAARSFLAIFGINIVGFVDILIWDRSLWHFPE